MRHVYLIVIYFTALLISTGCGLVQQAKDAIPAATDETTPVTVDATPQPAPTRIPTPTPDSDTGIYEAGGFIDDAEIAEIISEESEEVAASPSPSPTPEHIPDPATERVYRTSITICMMSQRSEDDSRLRVISKYETHTWSNGDRWVYSFFSMRYDYRPVGSFTAEGWYLADEESDGGIVNFSTMGHAVEAHVRGFRAWTEGNDLHVEEPGEWLAIGRNVCKPGSL